MLAKYSRLYEVLRTVNSRIDALTRAAAAGYNEMQGLEAGLSFILTQIKASVYSVERKPIEEKEPEYTGKAEGMIDEL